MRTETSSAIPHFVQQAWVITPVLDHFDPELEKNSGMEEQLNFPPSLGPYSFQHFSPFSDEDPLLRFLFYDDNSGDRQEFFFWLILE